MIRNSIEIQEEGHPVVGFILFVLIFPIVLAAIIFWLLHDIGKWAGSLLSRIKSQCRKAKRQFLAPSARGLKRSFAIVEERMLPDLIREHQGNEKRRPPGDAVAPSSTRS